MERLSEASAAVVSTIVQYYIAFFVLVIVILAFALYVYFFPKSIDFFANPEDRRLRSEPPIQD
jgi:hypothetical protein